ncbi:sensor domain-containing diguanylate cyclase [Vibrio sp. Isolate24]|uniref:sensor domain-containing diguanylate cyclase n=1 Tax=Vibrio sp. Isolate24 TaxID=2908534 RepID=UPI001EFE4924|nr:GGDEF domain-containing protein [Vibrio sp. Isolate24]
MSSTFSAAVANNPDLMHAVFESLPEPTFLLNKSGVYVEAWGGTDTKRHHNPASLIGLNQEQVLPADKATWFSQVIVDVINTQKPAELSYSLNPKDLTCFEGIQGPIEIQHFSALVIPLPNTEYVLWTVRNISEYQRALDKLAQQQLELERLTYREHLTQVYNRYAMDALLPDAIALARQNNLGAAVFMIDIDCFKEFNDHYGHIKGDEALKALGKAIKQWAHDNDLCFRYGGDEFLVFVPGISEQNCIQHAQNLLDTIAALALEHDTSHVSQYLTITVGIRHCDPIPADMTAEKFVGIADKALFFAKKHQRGTIHKM